MNQTKTIEFEFKITKKYSALITFIFLLLFLTFIEIALIIGTFKSLNVIFGLAIFTIYLFYVYRTFFWYLFGKENVKITQNNLIILKKGTFFVKPKKYELCKIKDIRIEQYKFKFLDFFGSRRSLTTLISYGCIVFDYENKTFNFGESIENYNKAEKIGELLKTKINEKYASR